MKKLGILSAVFIILLLAITFSSFPPAYLFSASLSLDPLLENPTYLSSDNYLINNKVHVLVSLNLAQEVKDSITPEYRKEYHEKLSSFLVSMVDQFQKTIDLKISGAIAGYLTYSQSNLNNLKTLSSITSVHLDKRMHLLLDESRDLTNSTPVYQELDMYGNKLKGTGLIKEKMHSLV